MKTPSVTVVIPAHARPLELRQAIDSVVDQDYPGKVEVIVVFDRADPDLSLARQGPRPVRVTANARTAGLAGARNTGILASDSELVAFCDDDDYWEPTKLSRQVDALATADRETELVTCAMRVEAGSRRTVRLAGTGSVTFARLLRSRMAMVHSSSLVFRRRSLITHIGLVNEEIPGSQNEDWDLLLRAARRHPIVHVDQPLVHVRWNATSFFRREWQTRIDSSLWMLQHHPELDRDRPAAARVMGKVAFGHAAAGHRGQALRWAGRTIRRDPRQWRGYLASAVTAYPPAGGRVLEVLNRFGRGV